MKFEISENFFIEGIDDLNWCAYEVRIVEEGETKGNEYKDIYGYFPNLNVAKKRVAERFAKISLDFSELQKVIDLLNTINDK